MGSKEKIPGFGEHAYISESGNEKEHEGNGFSSYSFSIYLIVYLIGYF